MPEYVVDKNHCGTHASGWLNDTHPTDIGVAVDSTVCFHWSSNPCYWSSDIQIMNCETYFLYYLPNTPNACSLRYCADGISTTSTTSPGDCEDNPTYVNDCPGWKDEYCFSDCCTDFM